MSGEEFRDMGYFPYIWDDVAHHIGATNPPFADLVREVNRLIETYNYYVSGDTGERTMDAKWAEAYPRLQALALALGPVTHPSDPWNARIRMEYEEEGGDDR